MGVIRIRESGEVPFGWNAKVSFDYGPEYDITIRDPFSEVEGQQLEWYFEKYPQYPFKRHEKAREVANSINNYGLSLFRQVFPENHPAYSYYRAFRQSGLEATRFEIAGSPKFHSLHWEALKDPERSRPLALLTTIVRQNLTPPSEYAQLSSSPIINLLVVTARPWGKDDSARYHVISRPLVDAIRNANLHVQIDILRPGTYKEFENHLRKLGAGYYHVIHFDMHGKIYTHEELERDQEQLKCYQLKSRYGRPDIQPYKGSKAFLFFESEEDNKADLVEAQELSDWLIECRVPVVILNACQSGKQIGVQETSLGSCLMQAGVQLVLAMGYSVNIRTAEMLVSTLYRQLFNKEDLTTAIRDSRIELYNNKERKGYLDQSIYLEDWFLPVIYQNQTQPLKFTVRDFTPIEELAYYERKAKERSNVPKFRYGFFGRDDDILQIEKRLLTKRRILLVRAMGGAGKTTLLRYLGTWWNKTSFIKRVFYFGYDKQAWTLQKIMDEVAQNLLDSHAYRNFQSVSEVTKQEMLKEHLLSGNYLLILDNLESILGMNLAIQNTLSAEEKNALHEFLAELVDGKTFILLGSRSSEDWLSRDTFEDNIYHLPGLDATAASDLAYRILKEQGNERYREDEDFHRLLRLLGGFPLAIEVILANLTRQTPTQILKDLQSEAITLVEGDIHKKKAEDIIQSVEYSHSNLSMEAQQLLLCLAPFSDIIEQRFLSSYFTYLQQTELATLSFEQWSVVLREAQNRGLLQPDHSDSSTLHIQPTFLYLLRSRLQATELIKKKQDIETAFRQLYYDQVGKRAYQLLVSLYSNERQEGQRMVSFEYENLYSALRLALKSQAPVLDLFRALVAYLNIIKDEQGILKLSQETLEGLQSYSSDKLTGSTGLERVQIIGNLASQQTALKQYIEAGASYSNQLEFLSQVKDIDEEEQRNLQAMIYHNLSNLAFTQDKWKEAEDYKQQSFNIKLGLDNPHSPAQAYQQIENVFQYQSKLKEADDYSALLLQAFTQFKDQGSLPSTYPNTGTLTLTPQNRQWTAELVTKVKHNFGEFNTLENMVKVYQHLGSIALEEQKWGLAEIYYQKAFLLYSNLKDQSAQDEVGERLGKLVELRQQICEDLLLLLKTFTAQNDTLRSMSVWVKLAQLWQQSNDVSLLAAIANCLKVSLAEIEEMLRGIL